MTVPQPDDSNPDAKDLSADAGAQKGAANTAERRKGPPDRRAQDEDRRNSDRVSQDLEPRRDQDRKDRRQS